MESRFRVTMYSVILYTVISLLVVVSVYLYVTGDYFRANVSLVSIGSILLPGFLYSQIPWLRRQYHRRMVRTVEATIMFGILVNAVGSLGLYYIGYEYDSVLHFFMTAISSFLLMCLIAVVLRRRKDRSYIGKSLFWGSFVVFLVYVVGWEAFEYFGDRLWGTLMSTDPKQPHIDTWVDIIWDMVGMGIAVLFGYYTLEQFVVKFRNDHNP